MSILWELLFFCTLTGFVYSLDVEPWSYGCDEHSRCVKISPLSQLDEDENPPLGLHECLLMCDPNALFWPRPRQFESSEKRVVAIDVNNIVVGNRLYYASVPAGDMLEEAMQEQISWLINSAPTGAADSEDGDGAKTLEINFIYGASSRGPRITANTEEWYSLSVAQKDGEEATVTANITAENYFGSRHALETLFQLLEYDDVRQQFIMLMDLQVSDYPEFSHRGITLDTSRNFITKEVIYRILDGMASSKMNVFHWHIVDSHSFPVELEADPVNLMVQYGAYDSQSYYSKQDIRDIVEYANKRGIRVLPEVDQPAHTGHGWNFPGGENYTVCLDYEPWYDYCLEPPCGQLNPSEHGIYDILELIYKEFYELFEYGTFHMGADEVHFPCWNSSDAIVNYMESMGWDRSETGFLQLWSEFLSLSTQRLKKASGNNLDIILWTSKLTQSGNIEKYVPKDEYIIEIWSNASNTDDPQIKALADGGYRMIFANVDSVYLDCGFGAWVGEGNNWCSPYKGWQLIYENDLYEILEKHGVDVTDDIKARVLGGETNLWTEQTDSNSVEAKLFPRASALAERLWSSPDEKWYAAEQRMLMQRRRLVNRGIRADRLQPEWCRRNTGQCYGPDDNPNGPPPATSTTTPATTTTESHEQPGSGEATIGGSSSLLLLGVAVSWTLYPS